METRENTVIVQFNNLQIIGIYIRPQCSADEVVEAIMSALELTDPEIPTLLICNLYTVCLINPLQLIYRCPRINDEPVRSLCEMEW